MRVDRFDSHLLHVPGITRTPTSDVPDANCLLLVELETDTGVVGVGFVFCRAASARALKAFMDDALSPMIRGEDPLDHVRLSAKAEGCDTGDGGLAARAYAALDLALWDVKGKVAGLPLYKLLGGARVAIPAFAGSVGGRSVEADRVVEAARPHLDRGLMGILVGVGGSGPEVDAERLTRIREALGDDVWLGVDAGGRYDYATALSMGRFFEEEMGVDWFENPIPAGDIAGHSRLCERLEVPVAAGSMLESVSLVHRYLQADAVDVVRPDVARLGGLTAWLHAACLAQAYHRPLVPQGPPEVTVHLGCSLAHVRAVEYHDWLQPLFRPSVELVAGRLQPASRPGLGLELLPDSVTAFAWNR